MSQFESIDAIRLDGRVAIVTGAARGLGRTMAQALQRAGCDVVFADIDGAAVSATAREVNGQPGAGRSRAAGCDVARREQCQRLVADCVKAFGKLHILINNAARGPAHVELAPGTISSKFHETDPAAWADVIVTNVIGSYYAAHCAAPQMLKAGWGRIVNITTSLSTMQRAANSPYGVSKAAIEAETLIWSQDLEGSSVTVNSLIPGGAVDTDFVSARMRAEIAQSGRPLLAPEVMVAPLLWLASTDSDGVSGARFVGKLWDRSLPPSAAAQGAREKPVLRPAAEAS